MVTKWLNENSVEYVIASAYAQGKGRLFEMFFGWRQTDKNGNCKMIFSRRDWENIDELIEYHNTYVKNT